MNVFCRVTLWTLMLSGAYGTLGTAEENIQAALLVLKSRLFKFYKGYEGHLTEIGSFTKKMVGTSSEPKCATKGAETWGLLLFLLAELESVGERVRVPDCQRLFQASSALKRMVLILRQHDWLIPEAKLRDARIYIYRDLYV